MINRKTQKNYDKDYSYTLSDVKVNIKDNIKNCKVFSVIGNKLFLYFDSYGIQIEFSKNEQYRVGDIIPVHYTGEIGNPDFEKWIVE